MVCLHVTTVNWHKSLQLVKKSNITLLPCLFMILLAVWIIILGRGITLYIYIISIIDTDTNEYFPCIDIFIYFELKILEYMLFSVTNRCFSGSKAVKNGLLLQRY